MIRFAMVPLLAKIGLALASSPIFAADWVTFPGRQQVEIKALVMKPGGNGPFPAIVAMHGCSGLFTAGKLNARHQDWANRLVQAGFVVVMPDSLGSRRLGSLCNIRHRSLFPRDRAYDAFAAAEWLARQPDIDRQRLGLMGWSHGGTTVLSASRTIRRPQGDVEFRQVVAFYPGCRAFAHEDFTVRVPVTIFHGLADDWTPAEPCQKLKNVRFHGYVGAHHDFDHPNLPIRTRKAALSRRPDGLVTIGTHPEARADAMAKAFTIFRGM
jgi:dienelactone hydrolase